MSDEEMKAAAEQVLRDGGCLAVRVEGAGDKWLVACGFEPGRFYASAFSEKNPVTPNDPVYLARQALAVLERNERPRAAPEPQNLPSLGEDIVAAEEEMGESPSVDTTPRDGGDNEPGGENPASKPAPEAGFALADPFWDDDGPISPEAERMTLDENHNPIDADFTEFGTVYGGFDSTPLEGEDLNTPQLEDASVEADPVDTGSEAPQDRFYGLDDLDRRRSLRIGDVVQAAAVRIPLLTDEGFASLKELRNFAMGVSENRWPNDPAKQAELDSLELVQRHANEIAQLRDKRVAFLLTANREEIEAFDPEADWP